MEDKRGIIPVCQLPRDEEIYMKKDMFGYRVVYPIKNRDGSFNWWNLLVGGKRNLVFLIIVMLCFGLVMYSYAHDIKEMKDIVENPCYYCEEPLTYSEYSIELPPIKYPPLPNV